MPTEVHNHINRLTMEVDSKANNPLEDATVYINCAVYTENGLLESPTMQTATKIDLCADKKIHFIEKSIERSTMAKDEENNEYGYMNGDCTADELKKFSQQNGGGYVAKTRVFQTQVIRITKTRKPLAVKTVVADNEKNVPKMQKSEVHVTTVKVQTKEKVQDTVPDYAVLEYKVQENVQEKVQEHVQVQPDKVDGLDGTKEAELQSIKHKIIHTAEEPPRKKRYLCRDIVIPAYGQLYKNEGLTDPSAKLYLEARSWSLGKGSNSDRQFEYIPTPEECLLLDEELFNADKIAEIVYTSFRPRVHKDKHVRLLFPSPYHPKDPEPEVQVQVVTPMKEKPEEILNENSAPKPSGDEDENDDDPRLSKRGRKKRNWFQRMWRNLRHHFQAGEQRDA